MTNKTTAKLTRVNILLARVDNLTPMARTPAKSKHNPAAKKSTYSAKYSKSIEANDKNAVLIASSDILLMYSLIPFATLAAPEKKKKIIIRHVDSSFLFMDRSTSFAEGFENISGETSDALSEERGILLLFLVSKKT